MQKTILIIEDDSNIRELLRLYLSQEGYKIETAQDGLEGLRAFRAHEPDLILLDLMMPGIDGFEVIRRLRANPETADIQIVILSALNSNEDVVKGFNEGANDFIMKPIIMEKLLSCVVTQMQLVAAKDR